MRIAIVGCGNIANMHAGILKSMNHEIVLAIDHQEENARRFADMWSIGRYSADINHITGSDIDCVHICTPPTKHYEQIKLSLDHGKHVICEKPMCIDSSESKELMLLAEQRGLVGALNFNVRFHHGCQEIKNTVHSDTFGQPILIHGQYLQAFHLLPAEYSWRYQPEISGPMRATTEIGSHWIDLARFLTGLEIVEVAANFAMFHPIRHLRDAVMYGEKTENSTLISVHSDDAAFVTLRFSNGALGNLLLSEVSHGRQNSLSVEVTSDKNSIWWNSESPYQINSSSDKSTRNISTNAFGGGFPDTFQSLFECVYHDIEQGAVSKDPSYPTFYDGYQNSCVCDAIYQSANNNGSWTKVQSFLK